MRYLWVFGAFLAVGVVLLKAQIFNLEEEDKIEPSKVSSTKKGRVPATILVPAAEVPEDGEDKIKLDKLYSDIVKELKANNIEAATKLISNKDVITKQKVIHRLMQENPDDFKQPGDNSPGSINEEAASE